MTSSTRPSQPTSNGVTPSSSSSSGLFRQRNGSGILSSQSNSGFFDRLRRPRTANTPQSTAGRERASIGGTDYSVQQAEEMMDEDHSTFANGASRGSRLMNLASGGGGAARSGGGLPRSNSSSRVHLPSSSSSPSTPNENSSRPPLSGHHSSQSQSNIRFKSALGNGSSTSIPGSASAGSALGFPLLSRTGSTSGSNAHARSGSSNSHNAIGVTAAATGSGTGPPTSGGFSRMFRRYSQGAGRNGTAANEAHAIAAASHATPPSIEAGAGAAAGATSHESRSAQESARSSSGDGSAPHSTNATVLMTGPDGGATVVSDGVVGSSSRPGTSTDHTLLPASNVEQPTHRIRLVPHLEATRSLHFEPIERDLVEGTMAVKIGRFTDRGQASSAAGGATESLIAGGAASTVAGSMAGPTSSMLQPSPSGGTPGARGGAIPSSTGGASRVDTGRIAFKSKVVSRGHAEIWCESGGKVFVRDTKSSSGTFLNHIRLSAPNTESKPFQIKDGDVVQLGVDYQGGTEEIYRCVKMRVELNRGWQRGANQFNVNALRQLRALQGSPLPDPTSGAGGKAAAAAAAAAAALPTNRQSLNVTDCCICLFSVTVCQALFIAPCSHVFHYKCIRPLLNLHHPGFSCPLCRTFADLEADVEEDEAWQQALLKEAVAASNKEKADLARSDPSTPLNEEPMPSMVAVAIGSSSSSDAEHFVDAAAGHTSTPASFAGLETMVNVRGNAVGRGTPSHDHSNDSSFLIDRRGSSTDESGSGQRSSRGVRSAASQRSGSSHRDSPLRDVASRRPDTAVSASTAIPFSTNGAAPSARSSPSSRRASRHAEAADGTQELLLDNPALRSARRPSGPIDISSASSHASFSSAIGGPTFARHLIDGSYAGSPGLSDSGTPQNEHFLSTLAETSAVPPAAMRSASAGHRSPST